MNRFYQLLELSQSATKEDAKTAYKRLSLIHHPDRPTGDREKQQQLNEAYENVLKNIERPTVRNIDDIYSTFSSAFSSMSSPEKSPQISFDQLRERHISISQYVDSSTRKRYDKISYIIEQIYLLKLINPFTWETAYKLSDSVMRQFPTRKIKQTTMTKRIDALLKLSPIAELTDEKKEIIRRIMVEITKDYVAQNKSS